MIKPTNLYIMKCERFHKIGITHHVPKRLKTLQSGLPFTMEIIANYNIKCADKHLIRRVERAIHKHFVLKRKSGEWFELTESDLESIPSLIKKYSAPQIDSSKEVVIKI